MLQATAKTRRRRYRKRAVCVRAYYNEIEPYAAEWLRNLIASGHIAPGEVDERDIREVEPDDLDGYTQCHFFAGIGGWSYALRLAGWPDERPVWTGSCPCQPLSCAGQRKGHADRRHLWPAFYRLIAECRPATILGEQTSGALGREWLAGVRADLDYLEYACGCADLPAAGVGAPHIRQRLWFVAERLADAEGQRRQPGSADNGFDCKGVESRRVGGMAEPPGEQVGDAGLARECTGTDIGLAESEGQQQGSQQRPWDDSGLIPCADGKARRVEPGVFPLVARATARVGRLRAYGNAIVPHIAAEFIRAYREVRGPDDD